jgi:phenylpyruvate tautomerase PptA (4-oxalocrotonate tautomerase family)
VQSFKSARAEIVVWVTELKMDLAKLRCQVVYVVLFSVQLESVAFSWFEFSRKTIIESERREFSSGGE